MRKSPRLAVMLVAGVPRTMCRLLGQCVVNRHISSNNSGSHCLPLLMLLSISLLTNPATGAERVIRGNLVLAGTQTMLISGETLRVQGAVVLRDQACLTIRTGTLEIVQSYHEEFTIKLEGSARLIVEDATINSNYACSIVLWDRSSLNIVRSKCPQSVVTLAGSSKVVLEDSAILMLSVEPTVFQFTPYQGLASVVARRTSIYNLALGISGNCKVSIQGLEAAARYWLPDQGRSPRFSFVLDRTSYLQGQPQYEVAFYDCSVGNFVVVAGERAEVNLHRCEIHQLGVYDYSRVTVTDSWVCQVVLRLGRPSPINVALGGLRTGWHQDWSLRATTGSLPCSLVLQRSYVVDGWYLRLNGGHYEIFDSVIARLRDEFDTPDSRYHVKDSCIREWQPWWDKGTVVLENCVLERVIAPDASSVTLQGTFMIKQPTLDQQMGPWRNDARIIRWFPVKVYGATGEPLAGVEVQLFDQEGRLVHSSRTDSNGYASPGLRVEFNSKNYTQEWTVVVPALQQSCRIGLLSPTPVTFPKDRYKEPTPPACSDKR
ncbi:MAG: hypothetical protein QXQ53_07060 [Candidatus Methanosuratincola sp.]